MKSIRYKTFSFSKNIRLMDHCKVNLMLFLKRKNQKQKIINTKYFYLKLRSLELENVTLQ